MISKLSDPIHSFRGSEALQKKWGELRFNKHWLEKYPDDVKFLVQTKLIYSILGFQNSTSKGFIDNKIKVLSCSNSKKGLWIKKEGIWVAISKIKRTLKWDPKERVLISRKNPLEKWCYFSEEGLLPFHTCYERHLVQDPKYPKNHRTMRPITQLSKGEMGRLLAHAAKFNSCLDCPPKGVLQFVTHPISTEHPSFFQNLYAQRRVHCGIRLITPDGAVYSFGLGADYREHCVKKESLQCLASVNGQPKLIDYLEFQKFDQRVVTTVPLNELEVEQILKQVNFYREKGIRFNVLRQNCVRFATHLLGFANISLNIRISLIAVAWRSLPNVEHFPVIGIFLGSAKRIIKKMSQRTAIRIPKIVKEIFAFIAQKVLSIPHLFIIFPLNLGLLAVGGRMASANNSLSLKRNSDSGKFESFESLLTGLFDPDAGYVHHPSIFIHWQLNQKTTEIYHYSGQPNLYLLPPQTVEDKLFSTNKKAVLKTMFKESKPEGQ
jgi:hypothetical protein